MTDTLKIHDFFEQIRYFTENQKNSQLTVETNFFRKYFKMSDFFFSYIFTENQQNSRVNAET